MSRIRISVLVLVLTIVALLIGCSGGSGSNPVTPEKASGSMDNVPIIGVTDANSSFNAIGLFGAYELTIHSDLTTEFVSKRVGAIGEDYIVSGLAFFTVAPCPSCLKMVGVEITPDGNVLLSFEISHPFKKGITGDPPSASNRLDLDVFDLAMVIAPTGGTAVSYALTGADVYPDNCVGADGYTTELAEVIDDEAALPFFLVIDDSDTGTSTWNKFAMGAVNLPFDVGFNLLGPVMTFDTYLTMGYGFGARKPDRLSPKYYNPEFNRKAAWKVAVTPPQGVDPPVMGNTWNDTDPVEIHDVLVEVYDWQIGATVSAEADFADADPDDVYAASEPSGVSVEIPGMNIALDTVAVPDVPTATGMADDPWVYTIPVANVNLIAAGRYTGLVKVTDERAVMAPADGRDFIIDTDDGIELVHYSMPEYATYQTFTATVVIGCGPITGTIDTPTCPVSGVFSGQGINFTCSAVSGNGGDPVILYEWDADYDGVIFDVDATGDDVCLGGFVCDAGNPVTYTVAVRGTDSCGPPPNVTVFATCEVTVDDCTTVVDNVTSDSFIAKDPEDEWFDIGVMEDSYVYVVCDHAATANVVDTRTAIMFDNDLTNMQVINSGTGMVDPQASGKPLRFDRIDVTNGGYMVTNPVQLAMVTWTLDIPSLTAVTAYAPNMLSCGGGYDGTVGCLDVWHQDDLGAYGSCAMANFQSTDCGSPGYGGVIKRPDGGTAGAFGGLVNPPMYQVPDVVASEGVEGTQNSLFFVSTATAAKLSLSGSWMDGAFFAATEIASTGTLGTADDEFSGGLDVAADSNGNIFTLEKHGCSYRFQKFDATLTWQWTSYWVDGDSPLAMDFDRGDDKLYVLCENSIHICTVN